MTETTCPAEKVFLQAFLGLKTGKKQKQKRATGHDGLTTWLQGRPQTNAQHMETNIGQQDRFVLLPAYLLGSLEWVARGQRNCVQACQVEFTYGPHPRMLALRGNEGSSFSQLSTVGEQ